MTQTKRPPIFPGQFTGNGRTITNLGDISALLLDLNIPDKALLAGSQDEKVPWIDLIPELNQPVLFRNTYFNLAQTPPEIQTILVEETVSARDENSETRLRTEIAEFSGVTQRADSVEAYFFTSDGSARFLQRIEKSVEST
ncbi:MAG: hypothetical protein R3F41_12105 [Gammaproteobacteria bacterium]|nr:hypothetical protein [Planctomycetaceae bacterium]MCP5348839.1 hypothetical protein [Pseudomonadales bacterium]